MENKKHTRPPLPFLGAKTNYRLDFCSILKNKTATFVDLFGGSGFLSHCAKITSPNSRVIWNDFDDYQSRLSIMHETEELRKVLRDVVAKQEKYTVIEKSNNIWDIIDDHFNKFGRIDIDTVSTWIAFSMAEAKTINYFKNRHVAKPRMYNCIPLMPLNGGGYLEGVERIQCDWKQLLNEFRGQEDVVFLCDPPYMMTDKSRYSTNVFGVAQSLELIHAISKFNFVYFTSTKSELPEIMATLHSYFGAVNIFENPIIEKRRTVNYSSESKEIMCFKLDL